MKKVITFEPTSCGKYINLMVDGREQGDSDFPDCKGRLVRRAWGLRGLQECEMDAETEKQYREGYHQEMLKDAIYTGFANQYYTAGEFTTISMAAGSGLTYDIYKKLVEAGYAKRPSFVMALSQGIQLFSPRDEQKEIEGILAGA
jgi:hypothetical protein